MLQETNQSLKCLIQGSPDPVLKAPPGRKAPSPRKVGSQVEASPSQKCCNRLFHLNRKKSGKVKTAYKREYVNLGCDVDFDFAGPTIHGAAVVGYEGWLAGYQMTFDTAKSKMTQSNFAIGYKTGDFQLHTNV